MSARSKARKRALDVIFAAEAQGTAAATLLAQEIAAGERPVSDYTTLLVRGIEEHLDQLDQLIGAHADGWALNRMPAVDRNVLRLGVFELLHVPDVPDAVAISEAVSLARDLSTDESPAFVNGVLGAILRDRAAGRLRGTEV